MFPKLVAYLNYESSLLEDLIRLAEAQQQCLINYEIDNLNEITAAQEEISQNLAEAEEQRIIYLRKNLDITHGAASEIKLSQIEKYLEEDEVELLKKMRNQLKLKLIRLHRTNSTNRVLTNRAHKSVGKIISVFASGSNHVCNVKV